MDHDLVPQPDGWDDPLTGMGGPELWYRVLVTEVARATKYRRPLTVVVVELDGLEALWDERGGDVGRHVLHEIAERLRRASRASDYCMRIATTRFGVVLTETDKIMAINYVERVRELVPSSMPDGDEGVRLSFGWASPIAQESADALVRRAERRMIRELTQGV